MTTARDGSPISEAVAELVNITDALVDALEMVARFGDRPAAASWDIERNIGYARRLIGVVKNAQDCK